MALYYVVADNVFVELHDNYLLYLGKYEDIVQLDQDELWELICKTIAEKKHNSIVQWNGQFM